MRIHTNDCKILYVPRTREREREGNEEWVRLICAMLFLLLTYVIDIHCRYIYSEMVKCYVALSF